MYLLFWALAPLISLVLKPKVECKPIISLAFHLVYLPQFDIFITLSFLFFQIVFHFLSSSLEISENDAAWVGAWWLGFSIASVLFLTVAALLLCFDRELPEAVEVRRTRVSEHHFSNNFRHRAANKYTLWHLPRHAFRLLRNPVFACASLSAAMEGAVLSGFATFLPKFIQSKFSQSAFMAALLTGLY